MVKEGERNWRLKFDEALQSDLQQEDDGLRVGALLIGGLGERAAVRTLIITVRGRGDGLDLLCPA